MPKRKTLIRNLDGLARKLLRAKQEDTCEYCGIKCFGRQSHVHHIRSRKYYNSRWDLRNLVLLCAKCHRWYHDGIIGRDWFKFYAPKCYEWLETINHKPTETWHDTDLKELEQKLKQELGDQKDANKGMHEVRG